MNEELFNEPYLENPEQFSRQIDALNDELLAQVENFIKEKEVAMGEEYFNDQIRQTIVRAMDEG